MAGVVLIRRRREDSGSLADDAPLFLSNGDGLALDELLEDEENEHGSVSGWQRLRLIVWITLEEPGSSAIAQAISVAMMLVISTSVFTFILGTEPVGGCDYDQSFLEANQTELALPGAPIPGRVVFLDADGEVWSSAGQRICPASAGQRLGATSGFLVYAEGVCVIIFTAELLLRFATCTTSIPLRRFVLSSLNWIDLAAILPFYVAAISGLASGGDAVDAKFLSVLRVLRLLRVIRIFKMGRHFAGMHMLLRTVVKSLPVFFIFFMLVTVCSLLFGTLIHTTESGEFYAADSTHVGLTDHVCADPSRPCGQLLRPDFSPSPYTSIPISMYWCMVTMSSVGYGDMFPITALGYCVGAMTILAGMMTLALPITIISANFDDETREHNRQVELLKRRVAERRRMDKNTSRHELANIAKTFTTAKKVVDTGASSARKVVDTGAAGAKKVVDTGAAAAWTRRPVFGARVSPDPGQQVQRGDTETSDDSGATPPHGMSQHGSGTFPRLLTVSARWGRLLDKQKTQSLREGAFLPSVQSQLQEEVRTHIHTYIYMCVCVYILG